MLIDRSGVCGAGRGGATLGVADGVRTLTVHRVEEMRNGNQMCFDMVFVRA